MKRTALFEEGTSLNAALVVLDVDPSIVRPGWVALVVTLFIGAALVLLFFSMRRQVRRISPDLPYAKRPADDEATLLGDGVAGAPQSDAQIFEPQTTGPAPDERPVDEPQVDGHPVDESQVDQPRIPRHRLPAEERLSCSKSAPSRCSPTWPPPPN